MFVILKLNILLFSMNFRMCCTWCRCLRDSCARCFNNPPRVRVN